MTTSTERYRLLVSGRVPLAVLRVMDDRFGAAAQVTPGARSTVIELRGDQARLRALLSLLWDVGQQVTSVCRREDAGADPRDATGASGR